MKDDKGPRESLPLIDDVHEAVCLVVWTGLEMQSRCVDDATAGDMYRGPQSQNSSDIAVAGSRCLAGNEYCGDGTDRMPERYVGASLASLMLLLLTMDLLKMLTLRP